MDLQKKLGKVLLPLVTPYGKGEEVDYDTYEKLI